MHDDELFIPGSVDEQIDLLVSPAGIHERDARLLERLQAIYAEDQESTARVWERLVRQVSLDANEQQPTAPLPAASPRERMPSMPQMPPFTEAYTQERPAVMDTRDQSRARGPWRRITALAAVLIALLLVGSLLWVLRAGSGAQIAHNTASTAEIYVNGPSGLSKFDSQTHQLLWHAPASEMPENIAGNWWPPLVIGQTVIVYYASGHLVAFNAQTGAERWSHVFSQDFQDAPFQDSGLLYVQILNNAGNPGLLYQIDPASGTIKDTYDQLQGELWSIAVSNGVLYYIGGNGANEGANNRLYAVRLPENTLLWQRLVAPSSQYFALHLSVSGGLVYVGVTPTNGENTGAVAAFNARTGQSVWQTPAITGAGTSWQTVGSTVLLDENSVNQNTYTIKAYNVYARKLVWQKTLPFSTSSTVTFITDAQDLYIGASDVSGQYYQITALDATTGRTLWQKQVDDPVSQNMPQDGLEVQNGVVYYVQVNAQMLESTVGRTTIQRQGNFQDHLLALQATDGSPLWTWDITSAEGAGSAVTLAN
jgi:outer membrane protein assembly factor BamB